MPLEPSNRRLYFLLLAAFACCIMYLSVESCVGLCGGGYFGTEEEEEKKDLIALDDVAIFTIALYGFNPTGLVLTLRSKGKWNGPIYVMSDRCTPRIDTATMLDFDGPHGLTNIERKMNARLLKTKILQFVHEKYVLFLDADIEVNHPIHSYLAQISSWESPCEAYFGHELWYKKLHQIVVFSTYSPMDEVWQGGLFFMQRDTSSKILAAWGDMIRKGTYVKDQPALVDAIADGGYKVCNLPDEVRYVPDFNSYLRGAKSRTFTHYLRSSTNRLTFGIEKSEPRMFETYDACDDNYEPQSDNSLQLERRSMVRIPTIQIF